MSNRLLLDNDIFLLLSGAGVLEESVAGQWTYMIMDITIKFRDGKPNSRKCCV